MSWFKTSNITSLAKSALKEAQKTIDKALDIGGDDSPSPLNVPCSFDDHVDKEKSNNSVISNCSKSNINEKSLDTSAVEKVENRQSSGKNVWDWDWEKNELPDNITDSNSCPISTTAVSDNFTINDVVAKNLINNHLNVQEDIEDCSSELGQTNNESICSKSPAQGILPSENELLCERNVREYNIDPIAISSTLEIQGSNSLDKKSIESACIANAIAEEVTATFLSQEKEPVKPCEADDSGIWDLPNLPSNYIDFPVIPVTSETTEQISKSIIYNEDTFNVEEELQSEETVSRPLTLGGIVKNDFSLKKSGYPQHMLSELIESTTVSSREFQNRKGSGEFPQACLSESVDLLSFPPTPSSVEILTEMGSPDDVTPSNENGSSESVELLSFPQTPSSVEILNEGSSSDDFTPSYINTVETRIAHGLSSYGLLDSSCTYDGKISTVDGRVLSEMTDLLDSEISHDESLHSSASADSSHTLIGSNDNDLKRLGYGEETADYKSTDDNMLSAKENLELCSTRNSSETDSCNEKKSTSNSLASWLHESFLKSDEKSNVASLTPDRLLSGHTSPDEVETTESTTTSSDIEIISSPNSENGQIQLSPGKFDCYAARSNHYLQQHRADTPSSDGYCQTKTQFSCLGHQRKSSEASSESSGDNHCLEIERLGKKITEQQEILDAREMKVLELSNLNAELVQTNELLQNQIKENNIEIKCLKDDMKELLIQNEKAKDHLQKSVKGPQLSPSLAELKKLIEEQDAVISELRIEGEKLSKQQFQQATHIKKLKSKEREMEALCNKLKSQIDDRNKELLVAKDQLKNKEEADKKAIEDLKQATLRVNKTQVEVNQLRQEIIDAESKNQAMKHSLDLAYKDIADLHHKLATSENKAAEMSLSAEMAARQELQLQLQEVKKNNQMKLSESQVQLMHLHKTLGDLQQQSSMIEVNLKAEIEVLQKQLQESELKNSNLNQDISNSTRPLLKQIENLQASFSTMQNQYELNEKHLVNQIDELEKKLAFYIEKERLSQEETLSASSRVSDYLREITAREAEISRLKADELQFQQSLKRIQSDKYREISLMEESNAKLSDQLLEMKKAHEMLLSQLESEREGLKYEKKKNIILEETIKEKNKKLEQYSSMENELRTPRDSPTTSLSKFSIASDSCASTAWPDDVFENSARFYPFSNSTSVMECLQSQVKQKDGEVMQWQTEVSRLEKVKESLAHEIALLNSSNIQLIEEVGKLKEEKLKNMDLEQKYNTLLQLYGEKIEENQELKLDLIDIKDMYKSQIDELVKGITQ